MKRKFTFLTAALALLACLAIPLGMRGQTASVTFSGLGYSNQQEITQVTFGGVTADFDKGTNSNAPKYYTSGTAIRVYGGNTVTITAGNNSITEITITFGSSDGSNAITSDVGTYDNGSWYGDATSVTFTVGGTTGNRRFAGLSVIYTGGGTQPENYTVTFDAGDGTFVGNTAFPNESNTVAAGTYTLPSANRDGYTFDGWTITGDANLYTGSYEVSDDVDFTAHYTENTPPTPGGDLNLTFDVSSNPGGWPTANSTTLTNYTYTLNSVDYTFALKNVKCNSGYLMMTQVAVLGLPAIEGYKLTKVVAHNSGSCSTSTQVGISSSASQASYIAGGEIQTWSTTSSNYTYNLTSTEVNTMYYLYVTNKNAQVTSLTLTYEAADAPSIATPVFSPADGTEFGNEGLSVTITCGTTGVNIYYTLDGSTPDNQSTPYNGAISLTETTTIKAIAHDGSNYSNVATATYTYVDPNAPGTENNPYTVAQARAAIDAGTGITGVYATGIISQVDSYSSQYNSITYWISEDGTTTSDQLEVYSGKGLNNTSFSSINDVEVGATVVVFGTLKKYGEVYEFDKNNYLTSYTAPVHAVEAPTFSPVAGTYAIAQTVELATATSDADIYYTLDGTDPDMNSTMYENPIEVNATTTIKAVAYDGDDTPSTIATATYHINSQDIPYTVTQALAFNEYPANGIYVSGIVSTAPTQSPTSNGELTYYISVDGNATDQLEVYKGKGLNEAAFTAQDDIQVGDIVTVYGNVVIYGTSNPIKEFASGNYLVSFERPTTPTPTHTLTFSVDLTGAGTVSVNGGAIENGASIAEGTVLNIAVTVVAGYTFLNWTTTSGTIDEPTNPNTTFTMGGADATLTAHFTQQQTTYTVTFDANGGTFVGSTDFPNLSNTVPAGTYTLPSATPADGYTFNGWAVGTTVYQGGTSYEVTGNVEFVASYTQNTSGAGGTDCLDNASTGVSGSTYTSWTTTGTSGAAYAGQSAGGDATSGACIQLRSNNNNSGIVTTTSVGKAKKVTVTWNENKTDVRTLNIYGSNTAYTSPTELYGSNPVGELIGTIVNGTSTELSITDDYAYIGIRSASGAIFLDAVCIEWEGATPLPTHTITLNQATGGVISADKQEAAEGETVTLTATPNVGYTFGGWTVTPASTTLIPNANTTPATFTMSTLNVIVTATFTPTTAYTVSFDINGKVEMTATVNSGEAINLNKFVADVTTEGYTFDGWYTATTGGTKVEGEYQPGEDVTLYALFTAASASDAYTLVTSTADLHVGDLVVIAANSYSVAMNTTQNQNNRGVSDIIKEDNTISWDDTETVCEFVLGAGLNDENWSFYDAGYNNGDGGYLCAAGNNSKAQNYLRTEADLTGNSTWEITFNNEVVSVVAQGDKNANIMQYNNNNNIFACYSGTTQKPLALYTKSASNSKGTRVDVAAKSKVTGIANNVLVTVKNNGIVYLTGANEGNSNNLVVEDGGQLVASNNVAGTMLKHVTGFGDDNTPSNYYLISTPFTSDVDATEPQHLVSSSYFDLYYFEQDPPQETGDNGLEWRNYKSIPYGTIFYLKPGIGYLYANKETCNVEFAGNLRMSNGATYEQAIEKRGEQTFAGWNLVGNPFTSNASVDMAFFKMNASKNSIIIVQAGSVIAPMEGVFVKTENATDVVTFTATTAPVTALSNSKRSISLNVNRDNELLDRAIVNVNAEGSLCKLCLSDNVTKIYFAQKAKEYALVSTGAQGEMPVSFKAAENGSYTISVDAENMEMNYLHLIDNMTGADVDLLATPSYTFEARTNDYTSRFRLVFSASNSTSENETETFAYYNGSEWVISNMGEATLQVIDVMGRVLSSETVNGFVNVSLNQTPGVYMLRLINGNSVKTQKIVVK